MDLKEIEKLMKAMECSSIKRIALKREGFEIELERECATHQVERIIPPLPKDENLEEVPAGNFVSSPMVGTFYAAPSPADSPFVKIGDMIEEDTVLCIVEAMKVMNEVKAGMRGKIVEILVKSGDPVEFGSNIFRVES